MPLTPRGIPSNLGPMADQDLKLNDKAFIVRGTFSGSLCSLVSRLTELGADVTYLTPESNEARRFCSNITDLKEVNPRYGRAVHVPLAPALDETSAENNIAKAVEVFGSIDGFVDLGLFDLDLQFDTEPSPEQAEAYKSEIQTSKTLSKAALKFLKGRNRGKLVLITHKLDQLALKKGALNTLFSDLLSRLTEQTHGFNIAVNCLEMGLSEEFVLRTHPSKTVQEGLGVFQKSFKNAQISDGAHLANMCCLLLSPYSNGVSGQRVSIDFGALKPS